MGQQEPFQGRGAASVPELLAQGAQFLTREKMSKAFVHTTRPSFYAVVLKCIDTREIA